MATQNGPDVSLPSMEGLKDFLEDAPDSSETPVEEIEVEHDPAPVDAEEDELPKGDTFDRKYVEKLRRESASYRERAKKFESMFEGYEDGAVDEWRTMISTFKSDPKSVAEQWQDLSQKVLSQFTPQEQDAIEEALNDEDQPLTMKQLQEILTQREQEQEMESMVRGIEQEAQDLGYNIKSREYKILLMTAQELPSGSLEEAHQLLEAEKQREFDKRIADLEKAGGGYIRPSDKVGVASQEKEIKTMADAKAALTNFLDSNR